MRVITNVEKTDLGRIPKMDLLRFIFSILPGVKLAFMVALLAILVILWKDVSSYTSAWVAALTGLFGSSRALLVAGIALAFILFTLPFAKTILGKHEYVLSSEGLYEKTPTSECLSRWEGITRVKIAGSYLAFQISGRLVHIVPARSFESKDKFREFVSLSVQYWQHAQRMRGDSASTKSEVEGIRRESFQLGTTSE